MMGRKKEEEREERKTSTEEKHEVMVIMGIDSKTDMWLARRKEWHGIG